MFGFWLARYFSFTYPTLLFCPKLYFNNQSVAPDGAQHAAPNKKGNLGRRKTGGAGRQSVVPAARQGTVVGKWPARRPGLLANQN
jgi:hypothetical protein